MSVWYIPSLSLTPNHNYNHNHNHALRKITILKQNQRQIPKSSPAIFHSFRSLLSSTGLNFLPLYKGLLLPLSAQIIYKSTIFTLHSYLLRPSKMGSTIDRLDPIVKSAIAGTLAGAVNALVWVTPVEYVRNNHIVNEGVNLSSFFQMWRGGEDEALLLIHSMLQSNNATSVQYLTQSSRSSQLPSLSLETQ